MSLNLWCNHFAEQKPSWNLFRQGPFKELYDLLTSHFKQNQKGELSQPKMREAKMKLLSKQIEWKKFSHLKPQHIFRNQTKHRKSEENFDLEKAAAIWVGQGVDDSEK